MYFTRDILVWYMKVWKRPYSRLSHNSKNIWKQLKCSSIGEWYNKTMECYSSERMKKAIYKTTDKSQNVLNNKKSIEWFVEYIYLKL